MSKSLGNSPDPLDLIEKFGADGVRVGMLLSSPAGNDLPFDSSQCEQGRNFSNKIWNAFRLVNSWDVQDIKQPVYAAQGIEWFKSKFNKTLSEINDSYDKFRISEALMSTYKLVWDDFCSWYLEIIKPPYQQPIDAITYKETLSIFESLLKVMHPFTPFISEEIWHLIGDKKDEDCIMVAEWPTLEIVDEELLSNFDHAEEVITNIRNIRKEKNIANKVTLDLLVIDNEKSDRSFDPIIAKISNLATFEYVESKVDNAFSFVLKSNEYFVPFSEDIDVEAEIKKIEEELKYTKGFLISVSKKLSNERFVSNAPEKVVAIEKKKMADAEAKVKILEEKLNAFA
jgi:valyl-tRNA synthetase